MERPTDRWRRIVDGVAAFAVLGGLATIAALAAGGPLRIGAGRFEQFVAALELVDFRGPLLGLATGAWVVVVGVALLWRQARTLGLASERVERLVEPLTRPVPVQVVVDAKIPVRVTEPLEVPVDYAGRLPVDGEVEVEAEIPMKTTLPIDTEVTTTVLRFGRISFPVKAEVPVDLVVPVKGRFRVKAVVPVEVRDRVRVELPPFEVPISSRIETKVDLLGSLKALRARGDE